MTPHEQKALLNALNYFLEAELIEASTTLGLPATGQRHEIITRIYRYLTTPESSSHMILPQVSMARPGMSYPLRKDTPILKGSFRTNTATKNFLQKLAGPNFYFSAFGQEWIVQQWQKGTPPTYESFARYWKGEQAQRAQVKETPPEDWAYHTFEQQFVLKNPAATKEELATAWNNLRQKQRALANEYIQSAQKISSSQSK